MSPPATKGEQKFIQQVIGVLLYYGCAIDSTIITGLSSFTAAQATPTKHTAYLVKWLLDYAASNPDTIVTYKKSNMVLVVHSNASYLSVISHGIGGIDIPAKWRDSLKACHGSKQ